MATAGFKLPKVNFLSISLDGGNDLLQKTDEPHTMQEGESLVGPATTSTVEGYTSSIMNVNLVLSVEVGFDQTKANLYSMFFKNDFTKYLKIRIVQSTGIYTETIANSVNTYLRPGGIIDTATFAGGVGNSPSVVVQDLDLPEYDGNAPELTKSLASSVEVTYDSSGNKIYSFPYSVTFQVAENEGGVDVENLSYFVHTYIDLDEFKIDNDLFENFEVPDTILQNLVMGEVNQANVIRGGKTNNYGEIFYIAPLGANGLPRLPEPDDDLELWTGPVHYHGEQNPGPKGYIGYMAGYAGADMGPYLNATSVFNGSIQDFRVIKQLEKLQFDYSLFSNSWFNEKTTRNLYNNAQALEQYQSRENPYFSDTYGKTTIKDLQLANLKGLAETKGKSAIFSNLYTAMDGSGNTRFLFTLNIKEALRSNSAFPGLLDHIFDTDLELANDFVSGKIITDFKIFRHRVHEENPAKLSVDKKERIENEEAKIVIESSDNSEGVLSSAKNEIELVTKGSEGTITGQTLGTIQEIDLELQGIPENASKLYGLRHYTGVDLGTPIDGDYMFSIEIKMKDPLIPWMKSKIELIEEIIYGGENNPGFSNYVKLAASDPKYFNSYTNRFTQAGIEKITSGEYENINGVQYVESTIIRFFQELNNFIFFDQELPSLYNFLTAIASPAYGNPSGAAEVLKIMENIYSKILNVFSSASKYKKAVDSPYTGEPVSPTGPASIQLAAGSTPKRSFVITSLFPQFIKGEINHSNGYDYMSIEDTISEDTAVSKGLKRLSRNNFDDRANLEETKYFTNIQSDYDILIPQYPLAFDPQNWMTEYGGAVDPEDYNKLFSEAKAKEGQILNPGDQVAKNKYAYFSPSVVSFAGEDPINLLNNGSLETDTKVTNNVMLNTIRYNLSKQNEYDYPRGGAEVATGAIKKQPFGAVIGKFAKKAEVVISNDTAESKYDLLNILSQQQTTVQLPPPGSTQGTGAGIFGGMGDIISDQLLYESEIAIPKVGIGTAPGEGTNIFNSKIDPSNLLLTITQEDIFGFLGDKTWKWKHYVMDFNSQSFFSEFKKWMGMGGNAAGPRPLQKAPNQVKCLMSNLDYTKPFSVGAFNELLVKILDLKPGVYENFTDDSTKKFYVTTGKNGEETIVEEPSRKVIYETPEFFSFFLLNFKNLVEVQVLMGYEEDESGYNVNAPIWKMVDFELYESLKDRGKKILARLVPYEKDLYGVKRYSFMEMPIYNMHFIIDFGDYIAPQFIPEEQDILEEDVPLEIPEEFIPVGDDTTRFGESITTGIRPEGLADLGVGGFIGGFAGGVDVGTGAGVVETVGGIAGTGTGEPGVVGGPLGPGVEFDTASGKKVMDFLAEKSRLSNRLGVRSENVASVARIGAQSQRDIAREYQDAGTEAPVVVAVNPTGYNQ